MNVLTSKHITILLDAKTSNEEFRKSLYEIAYVDKNILDSFKNQANNHIIIKSDKDLHDFERYKIKANRV